MEVAEEDCLDVFRRARRSVGVEDGGRGEGGDGPARAGDAAVGAGGEGLAGGGGGGGGGGDAEIEEVLSFGRVVGEEEDVDWEMELFGGTRGGRLGGIWGWEEDGGAREAQGAGLH